jgi:hypothetical protein
MEWKWRGEMFPATREETESIRSQLSSEAFGGVPYRDLPLVEQEELLKARLKLYCQTVYKHVKDTVEVTRQATICQRENPFYVQVRGGAGERALRRLARPARLPADRARIPRPPLRVQGPDEDVAWQGRCG